MKLKHYSLWAFALAFAAVSCSDDLDNPGKNDQNPDANGQTAKINIAINTETTTKATPGEDGDNNEVGLANESKVHDVTLILYDRPENANNWNITKDCNLVAAGWTDQVGVMEDSNVTTPGEDGFPNGKMTTIEVKVADPTTTLATSEGKEYGIIVVTNLGSKTELADKVGQEGLKTVDDFDKTLYGDIKDKKFVMSTHSITGSAGNSTVTLKTNDTKIPTAVAYVERLSAKIRIAPNTQSNYTYTIPTENQSNAGDEIVLTDVAIVNQLTSGSFLLKRVTPALETNKTDLDLEATDRVDEIIGDEKGSATEAATNFVIDPWTCVKKKESVSNTLSYSGTTPATNLAYTNRFEEKSYNDLWSSFSNNTTTLDATKLDDNNHQRLCYTQENTTNVANSINGYSTGALFKATYYPKKWSVVNENDGSVSATDIEYGDTKTAQTFYTYNNAIYKDYKSILAMFLKSGDIDYADFTNTDDANFATNINALVTEDPFGYIKAMQEEAKKESHTFQTPEDYLKSFNNDWTDNQKKEFNAKVKKYTDGVCYYPYWIRHADNGKPTQTGVMEFAIVRNNIYDLKVTAIRELGLSEVDVTDPENPNEDSSLRIQVQIYVKNWVVRSNEQIIL